MASQLIMDQPSQVFQKTGFDSSQYLSSIQHQYSEELLGSCGFNRLNDIDHTYDLLVRDLLDLIQEISLEKQKHTGVYSKLQLNA